MSKYKKVIMIFTMIVSLSVIYSGGSLFPKPGKKASKKHVEKTVKPVKKASGDSIEKTAEPVKKIEDKQPVENENNNNDIADSEKSEDGSLYHTITRGGPLMVFLILLGITSLSIIIERVIYFTRHKVWDINTVEEHLKEIHSKSKTYFMEDREYELKGALQLYINSLERGMAFLSGIGNLSPIVGFLGTVIGMIAAFAAIAAATTVNAKVVAVGIQIALITTAGGLIVAAPTLLFFYLFSHIIQNRYTHSEAVISRLCENHPRLSDQIRTGKKKPKAKSFEESYE